jgi:two-component system sensor histidine kinase RegB
MSTPTPNEHLVAQGPAPSSPLVIEWLVGLRWPVFGFLAATLPLDDRVFGFHVHYAVAVPLVAAVLALNAVTARRLAQRRPFPAGFASAGVALDLLAIGGLLAASGGAANPFSAVFFVHVALAASILPARTTFVLSGLAACVFASLFALPSGGCCPNHPANTGFSAHLIGMWFGFVVAAALVAVFLTRLRRALDERNEEVLRLRHAAEENARFAALGTLAAGTAHELGTPLGTISVLAGELADAQAAAAIVAQVTRCRDILTKMATGGRESQRMASRAALAPSVRQAVACWRRAHPGVAVTVVDEVGAGLEVALSEEDVEATLCVLLDNAFHANAAVGSTRPIGVAVAAEETGAVVVVEDSGVGVAPALQGRLGEPFLTSKEPGEGMGLGLYLVRNLLRRVGGTLEVSGREPQGTQVMLRLVRVAA